MEPYRYQPYCSSGINALEDELSTFYPSNENDAYLNEDTLYNSLLINKTIEIENKEVDKIKSYLNREFVVFSKQGPQNYKIDFKIITMTPNLERCFERAKHQLIKSIKNSNDLLFLSAIQFDSNSTLHGLPVEIGKFILNFKYPFLIDFEDFRKEVETSPLDKVNKTFLQAGIDLKAFLKNTYPHNLLD